MRVDPRQGLRRKRASRRRRRAGGAAGGADAGDGSLLTR